MTPSRWPGSLLACVLLSLAARAQNHSTAIGQWPTPGSDWHLMHYSAVASISAANVKTLGFAWLFETGTSRGLEATPLVIGTTLFTSGVSGRVYALDAVSGRLRWKFEPEVDMQAARATCCDLVNRGVAFWEKKVYVAALDG
jgi:quinohemoprotein ethanol dehydrogenase